MKKSIICAFLGVFFFPSCGNKSKEYENEKNENSQYETQYKAPEVVKTFTVRALEAKERLNKDMQLDAYSTGKYVTLNVTLYDNGSASCQYGGISPSTSGEYDFVCWGDGYRYYFDSDEMIVKSR